MQSPTAQPFRIIHRSNRLSFVLLLAAAAAMLLASCGDSEGNDQDDGRQVLVAPDPPDGDLQGVAPVPPDRDDESPALFHGDEEFIPGGFATVYLLPGSDDSDMESVFGVIDEALADSEFSYSIEPHEPYAIGILELGLFETNPDLLLCHRYNLSPRIDIELKEPDPDLLARAADALAGHPAVVSIESPGLEFGYTEVPPELADQGYAYEEVLYEQCDAAEVWVLVDPSFDGNASRALAERILALPSVAGVMIDREFEDEAEYFRPDLSDYPEMANCEGPSHATIRAIVPAADKESADEVVNAFVDDPAVFGFLGRNVDDSLDPILKWENAVDFEQCERLYAYLDLVIDISDADAAVVVARALAVPGVADIDLSLYDPDSVEGCEDIPHEEVEEVYEGEAAPDAWGIAGTGGALSTVTVSPSVGKYAVASFSPSPCFVPQTSNMTIYRGDPDLATQRALAEALCDLPGVLSIGSYDEAISDLDPYADCQALHLDVRLSPEASEAAKRAVRDLLNSRDLVLRVHSFDEFFTEEAFARPIPEVVVGDIDVFACDPELAWESGAMMNARLMRIDEQQARALADEILAIAGVVDVTGSAVRLTEEPHEDCGPDFIWFWFSPESTDTQRSAVFDMLAARPDVVAVTLVDEGETHVHDGDDLLPSRWAGSVKFASEDPPANLDALIAQIESMPGVAKAENPYGDEHFGGDVVEEIYEEAPEPVG